MSYNDIYENHIHYLCEELQEVRERLMQIVNTEGCYIKSNADTELVSFDSEGNIGVVSFDDNSTEGKIISNLINGVSKCSSDLSSIVSCSLIDLDKRRRLLDNSRKSKNDTNN